jgi:uncharacterized protein (DUF58 family)
MKRWICKLAILLGLALLAAAVWMYFARQRRAVTIDRPLREALTVTAGTPKKLTFEIHNPTQYTARVVGVGFH